MAASPIYLGAVKSAVARLTNADGTALITLWTPPTSGSKISSIGITSDDTANRDVALYVTKGGVDYPLGTVQIPLNAGFVNNVPGVDILGNANLPWVRQDPDGAKYLYLENGAVLRAKALVAVTAGKFINFFMQGGDF